MFTQRLKVNSVGHFCKMKTGYGSEIKEFDAAERPTLD